MSRSVLVLNSNYAPLHVCSTRRAIVLILTDKAYVEQASEDMIVGSSIMFEAPSVIRLKYFVKRPFNPIPLTRQNIYARDQYTCQYCGSRDNITIDHVKPQRRGGEWTWDNLVTCCFKCNNKKGDKLLEDSGLILVNKPRKPSYESLLRNRNKKWHEFLPN